MVLADPSALMCDILSKSDHLGFFSFKENRGGGGQDHLGAASKYKTTWYYKRASLYKATQWTFFHTDAQYIQNHATRHGP